MTSMLTRLQEALTQLPWLQRSCLLLSMNTDFTQQEIAHILDVTQEDVNIAVREGRERFHRAYHQGLQLDHEQRRVRIDGMVLPKSLPRRQFQLLEFPATRAGKICPRHETSQAVYGERYIPQRDNARLDALIERTRLLIGDDQRCPRFIETVRGVGHRLNNYSGTFVDANLHDTPPNTEYLANELSTVTNGIP